MGSEILPLITNLNSKNDNDLVTFCKALNRKGMNNSQIVKASVRLFMQAYQANVSEIDRTFYDKDSKEQLLAELAETVKPRVDKPKSKRKAKEKVTPQTTRKPKEPIKEDPIPVSPDIDALRKSMARDSEEQERLRNQALDRLSSGTMI